MMFVLENRMQTRIKSRTSKRHRICASGLLLTGLVTLMTAASPAEASCSGNPGPGCALPEHEEPKAPSDVSYLAGKDVVSVTPYGGSLVVQATDVSVPSIAGFAMHMTRTYHSNRLLLGSNGGLEPDFLRRRGPLGVGWSFHYGVIWPVLNSQTNSLNYELVNGDGSRETFYPNEISSGEIAALKSVAPMGSTPFVSKSLGVLYVDPSNQDRILVHQPNGLKVTFQRLSTLLNAGVSCPGFIDIGGAAFPVCGRFVATQIADLSGNEWTLSYAADAQEYVEHPIVTKLRDAEGRELTFEYGRAVTSNPVSANNPRFLDKVKLAGDLAADYTVSTVFGSWHVLDSVNSPAGRTTTFTHDRSGSSGPLAAQFGLLTGVESPLGGGIGVVYSDRQFRAFSLYPRTAWVKAVDRVVYDTSGVKTANGALEEAYSYADGATEFVVTVQHKVGSTTKATRTLRYHTYPEAGCSDIDKVGLEISDRLQETAQRYTERTTVFGLPLVISNRALNFYCPATTRPTLYRPTSATETDSATGGYELTTTPSAYDYFQPTSVVRSNGTSVAHTFQNVIASGRLALGLPASFEARVGTNVTQKSVLAYNSGSNSHLASRQEIYKTTSEHDTITFTYHTSGSGKKGALSTATRGGAVTTYDYSKGIVSSVTFPGGTTMNRASINANGTYTSETRHGVTTQYTWDADWRLTSMTAGQMETVNIGYCSQSQSGCSTNTLCVARGVSCSAGLGAGDGRRITTFDELGRKIREEDIVDGSTKSSKSWSTFDYAGRPTTYLDPIRGELTLAYDAAGWLVEEKRGTQLISGIARTLGANGTTETITKEGVVLFNEDDSAGRPTLRGFRRDGEPRVNMTYAWSMASGAWKSEIRSTEWSGVRVTEHHDLLGRLIEEERPEVGTIKHAYDARGFRTKSEFVDLNYALCHTVNNRGQITETKKASRSCTGGEIIQTTSYHGSNTQPETVTARGARFNSAIEVKREYGMFDSAARAQELSLHIPRALDAPAPWQGAELFPQAPDAESKLASSILALTEVEEVRTDGFYEMEVRAVTGARSLMPAYDWGAAQKECETGTVLARDEWTAGAQRFTGADLEAHVQRGTPGYRWDMQPDTLYCWRARAVKCHDGRATCQNAEVSPFGHWGLFALNNSVATPVTTDGWDQIPTNKKLNAEETYLPCIGIGCPNVAVRGGDAVVLTAARTFNLAGRPLTITYPSADSSLEGWFHEGAKVFVEHNALGDAKKLEVALADGMRRQLVAYTSFNAAGAPTAGTMNVYGYGSNQPGQFGVVGVSGGEVGIAATAHNNITLSWSYDGLGRLEGYSAQRGNDAVHAVSGIQYTADSLIKQWTRADTGLSGTYSATYDALGQLKTYGIAAGSHGTGTVTYAFDANGNLTERTGGLSLSMVPTFGFANGVETQSPDSIVSLPAASFGAFDSANRSASANLGYDAEGRLIRDHDVQLIYSHEDHVETIKGPDGRIERQMLYDGEGNLARLVSGSQTHYYLRDEYGRLLYEEVHDHWFYGSHFRDSQQRVVPNTRRYEYVYMGDSHVATIEHSAGVSSIAYHVRDWRDFEAVSIDADDAFARAYKEPSPYGIELRSNSRTLSAHGASLPAPFLQDLGINGYLNNGWRTVDGWSGRFSRPDPARARHDRFPQGSNLYANNLNNPLNYRDQDGQVAFLIPAAIIAYRVWSAYETANDVITIVDMVTDPNVTTGDLVSAGAGALAGVVLGKAGGKLAQAGAKYGKGAYQRASRLLSCKECKNVCFASGTLVQSANGPIAIDDLQVGDRVETITGEFESAADATWRVVHVEMPNPLAAKDIIRASLLRSPKWLAAHGELGPGTQLYLKLEEIGVEGWATVTAVSAPELKPSAGRLVVTTVTHLNSDLYELRFSETEESLRPTGRHKLYSLDRAGWVQTENLFVGERLQTMAGELTVAAIERLPGTHRVFNLGVEADHEFLVGDAAIRAHNMDCDEWVEVGDYAKEIVGRIKQEVRQELRGAAGKGKHMGGHGRWLTEAARRVRQKAKELQGLGQDLPELQERLKTEADRLLERAKSVNHK